MDRVEVIDGAVVRYGGVENGPVLVFLHCFGDTAASFDKVFKHPALQKCALVAPDLWGFGASPRRADAGTIAGYSRAFAGLLEKLEAPAPIGLIGHSIMAAMTANAARTLGSRVAGVFSIEGCLTDEDTLYPGKAMGFEDPDDFKAAFLEDIWELGTASPAHRHFYSGATLADPVALWELGRDTHRAGLSGELASSYVNLEHPTLYFWSNQSTPRSTQDLLKAEGLQNRTYTGAGHWPMVEQPAATAEAVHDFFDQVME